MAGGRLMGAERKGLEMVMSFGESEDDAGELLVLALNPNPALPSPDLAIAFVARRELQQGAGDPEHETRARNDEGQLCTGQLV